MMNNKIEYLPLDEKTFDRLPNVFKEIIKWDSKKPENPLASENVVSIHDAREYMNTFKDWVFNKNNLIAGAERFISKQRSGNPGAA